MKTAGQIARFDYRHKLAAQARPLDNGGKFLRAVVSVDLVQGVARCHDAQDPEAFAFGMFPVAQDGTVRLKPRDVPVSAILVTSRSGQEGKVFPLADFQRFAGAFNA